jgi:Uma2 family endonuclease
MPAAVTELPAISDPPRKRWTRAECEALASSGVLDYEHLELVDGELITKMGKKRPHVNSQARLHAWLISVFGFGRINLEAPIDVGPQDNFTNEPVPDLIVLSCDFEEIVSRNPHPDEVLLAIEIAHTTLSFDLRTKAALYARAGIPEYWVLDIAGRRLFVHREPREGQYRSITSYAEDESVATLAAPGSEFRIRDAFPQ